MALLSELRPTQKQLVMDLVETAGVDVSDWANFKGGRKRAASNPKYCYEWSFVVPGKLVVLNLWHASMKERGGKIFEELNLRESAERYGHAPRKPAWERRAHNFDLALQAAVRERLPIWVVICDGKMHDVEDDESKPSRVKKRSLDPVPWAATAYDWATGSCTVTRGAIPDRFADQFSLPEPSSASPERQPVSVQVFVRSAEVRRCALLRANGACEWCAQPGFQMGDGKIYLETHHVIPLAAGGLDIAQNVVALCPNHHREAHHGAIAAEMRKSLLARVSQKN
jgi:5-methylcytosine-specific restriction enzyme A